MSVRNHSSPNDSWPPLRWVLRVGDRGLVSGFHGPTPPMVIAESRDIEPARRYTHAEFASEESGVVVSSEGALVTLIPEQ